MERFMWQSYPQHLQNTLFHAERIAPLRKKSLAERLNHAYEFKGRGDARLSEGKYREAQTQYEFAYGLFKYCDKVGRKISMHDDTKQARELREQNMEDGKEMDQFSKFWLEVDEMMCSCLTMMTICKCKYKTPLLEEALTAANEALEFNPCHSPALYRRSQVHEAMEMYGEAVDDARNAYTYAPEELKFEMWKHRKHAIAERRANTFFWGFCGFMYDLPRNIITFPRTFANMPQRQQTMLILVVALVLGIYRMPTEIRQTFFEVLSPRRLLFGSSNGSSGNATAVNSSGNATDLEDVNATGANLTVPAEAAAELAAAASKAGAAILAASQKKAAAEAKKAASEAKKVAAAKAKQAKKEEAVAAKRAKEEAKAKAKAEAEAAKKAKAIKAAKKAEAAAAKAAAKAAATK